MPPSMFDRIIGSPSETSIPPPAEKPLMLVSDSGVPFSITDLSSPESRAGSDKEDPTEEADPLRLPLPNGEFRIEETGSPTDETFSGREQPPVRITLTLKDPSGRRTLGWVEFVSVPASVAPAFAEHVFNSERERLEPAALQRLLHEAKESGVSFRSDMGTTCNAITERYTYRLNHADSKNELDEYDVNLPIKILELQPNGEGKRLVWAVGASFPTAEERSWAPGTIRDPESDSHFEPDPGARPVTWIDITNPNDEQLARVAKQYKVPLRALRDALQPLQSSGVNAQRNHILITTRLFELGEDHSSFSTPTDLAIVLFQDNIITLHSQVMPAMSDVRAQYELHKTSSHSLCGVGAVAAQILEECAQENIKKLEVLKARLAELEQIADRGLLSISQHKEVTTIKRSLKKAQEWLQDQDEIPGKLSGIAELFHTEPPESVCRGFGSKLAHAKYRTTTNLDAAQEIIEENRNRWRTRAGTIAGFVIPFATTCGLIQALADGGIPAPPLLAEWLLIGSGALSLFSLGRSWLRDRW